MSRRMRNLIAIVATAGLTLGAPVASALEGGDEPDEPKLVSEAQNLSFWFDEVLGLLVYGVVDQEAEEPLDCTPTEDLTVDEEGTVDGMVPEGCMTLVIEGGPNGISHGHVVSQTVHALKEIRDELDAPFGHYVREIARSDAGKGDPEASDGTDEDTSPIEDDDVDGPKDKDKDKDNGPPEHANAHGHDKRHGSESTSNGHGPPAHANAHGRDK